MSRRWAGVLLTVAALLGGCDRADQDTPGNTGTRPTTNSTYDGDDVPTTSPTTTTSPATTQAAESLINIDGNLVLFPPARVRFDEADGKLVARLFSDDPKGAALDANYDGNSFYLQIELDAADPKELNGMAMNYRAPSSERDDSPYGIFLEGRRWVLQPAEVRVAFEGSGTTSIEVQLNGTFLIFDSENETAKPKRAIVAAKLPAAVQARK
ncbi:MAG: hypothetical protein WBD40_12585 [Tepidisphaeraceae bacterium]